VANDWQKGGLRYAKLKQIIPSFTSPADTEVFFVGVRRKGGAFRLINPFSPLQREYAIAATPDEVLVLRLKRPGVFRAAIKNLEYRDRLDTADLRWKDGRLYVADVAYQPIAFHDEDAKALLDYVNERRNG